MKLLKNKYKWGLNMFKFFKKNKTQIKIGVFVGIILMILQFIFNIKVLSWILNKIMYIFKISVPFWVILILGFLVLFLLKIFKNKSSEKIPKVDPHNYYADKMFGVILEFSPNAYDLKNIIIHCPNCLYRLQSKRGNINWPLYCEECGFETDLTVEKINRKIKYKLENKIKTGKYEEVVGKEPKDFLESEDEIQNKSSQKRS
jgi:hypothetical protein